MDCGLQEEKIEQNMANETINIEKNKEGPAQRGITGQAIYLLQTNESAKVFTLMFFLVIFLLCVLNSMGSLLSDIIFIILPFL